MKHSGWFLLVATWFAIAVTPVGGTSTSGQGWATTKLGPFATQIDCQHELADLYVVNSQIGMTECYQPTVSTFTSPAPGPVTVKHR